MTAALALTRLLQFLAAAALGGAPLFHLYGHAGTIWPRWMLRLAAVAGAFGVLGWLMAQAAVLFADPAQAFHPASVWSVVADTGFGAAAAARLGLFLIALLAVLAMGPTPSRRRVAGLCAVGALAAASFAWTGHGAAQDGWAGAIHAVADVLHLLAASVWIGALFVLAGLALRRDPAAAHAGLAAFSGIGPVVVAVLVLTGLVNSWFLVGPGRLGALVSTPYGRLLSLKLAMFAAMLGLAAFNRWMLTPGSGVLRLRASVVAETLLGISVLVVVAWLGTLAPPAEG